MGMGVRGVMLTFAVPAMSELFAAGKVSIDLARGNEETKKTIDTRNRIFRFFIVDHVTAEHETGLPLITISSPEPKSEGRFGFIEVNLAFNPRQKQNIGGIE